MSIARITWRCCLYLFYIILFSTACTPSTKKDPAKQEDIYPAEQDKPDAALQEKEPKVHIVEIKQMMFQPSEMKVHKGDQVLWINKDITDHDVTEQTAKGWASSPLANGESWSLTVTKSTGYYCNLHQVMRGKIIVE